MILKRANKEWAREDVMRRHELKGNEKGYKRIPKAKGMNINPNSHVAPVEGRWKRKKKEITQ